MTARSEGSDGGLRFDCTQCGQCCLVRGEHAYVYVSHEEVRSLANFLGITQARFKRRYTFVDEGGWRQLRFQGDRCVFLDEANRCTVYPVRPTQCRTFPFWPELVAQGDWTDEARSLCEGVGKGRLYSIQEAEKQMIDASEED